MDGSTLELDCTGLQCPAPILEISKAAKSVPRPTGLQVRADDPAFAGDIRAWCRSTGAVLESLADEGGVQVARISLGQYTGRSTPEPAPTVSRPPAPSPRIELDCRSMRCPEPILHITRAARAATGPSLLLIQADDPAFPPDLEAWCRSTGAEIVSLERSATGFLAEVKVQGTAAPGSSAGSPPATGPLQGTASQLPSPAPPPPLETRQPGILDLRGQVSELALLQLGQRVLARERVEFIADPGPFQRHLEAWAQAISARFEVAPEGAALRGWVELGPQQPQAPAPPAVNQPAQRLNKATLLVLHNDFEPLMAALMVANASAAQGMEVEVYFAFWGVNVLRSPAGTRGRPLQRPAPLLKRLMKWMMPAGPDAQQLSKMNMGGIGVEMMKSFMRSDNILGIRQLMEQASQAGVKFVVCSMSMGLMGIDEADLLELPNLSFGGVTAFSAAARESSLSLVF